jgi:AcrR family transcriptional regulator
VRASVERRPAFTRLDPDGRRRQILEAARSVFSEQPYASVSVQDIARAAGVTRGLVHHYFGGKNGLLREVVAALAEQTPRLVNTDRGLPLEERATRNVAAWLDFIEQHRELALAIGAGGTFPQDPQVAAIAHATREEVIDRILQNHLGTSQAPACVRFMMRSYLGLADFAAREWLQHRRAARPQVQTLLVTALIAMMRDSLPALIEQGSEAPATSARIRS